MSHPASCPCSFCRTFVSRTSNPFSVYDKVFVAKFNFVSMLMNLELVDHYEGSVLIYGKVYKK